MNEETTVSSFYLHQNTKEKFDAMPEDCDQKEMYKLLVRWRTRNQNPSTHGCISCCSTGTGVPTAQPNESLHEIRHTNQPC